MSQEEIRTPVKLALEEDIGSGDITASLIPEDTMARATVISRETAMLCGKDWFDATFAELDSRVRVEWQANDGDEVLKDQVLCTIEGPARAMLAGERTALNFLQFMSGTATQTHKYAKRVSNLKVTLLDTRKTVPGMRIAQKYAVRCGGGVNHRMGLYDAILIKENHIAACGSITLAIRAAKKNSPDLPIEVEVESIDEVQEALDGGADALLLDNFNIPHMCKAVALNKGRARLEASGGITLDNIREVAGTGIDCISVGALTKEIPAVDLSMRFESDDPA